MVTNILLCIFLINFVEIVVTIDEPFLTVTEFNESISVCTKRMGDTAIGLSALGIGYTLQQRSGKKTIVRIIQKCMATYNLWV